MRTNDETKAKPGRKPYAASGEVMTGRQVKMTDAEWQKAKALGGAAWIRARIKAAKEPAA